MPSSPDNPRNLSLRDTLRVAVGSLFPESLQREGKQKIAIVLAGISLVALGVISLSLPTVNAAADVDASLYPSYPPTPEVFKGVSPAVDQLLKQPLIIEPSVAEVQDGVKNEQTPAAGTPVVVVNQQLQLQANQPEAMAGERVTGELTDVSAIENFVTTGNPSFQIITDENNGFGVEGARKIEASIEDIEDYYLKTFGPPIEAPEGPILVAKAPNNSSPRAYSYGESENYPNGAIFVPDASSGYELAHETKHKFPLPYESSGLLEMNGVDHLGGELFTVAAARQWGIDRRNAEPQYLDEGSLVYQSLRRDDKFFVKLNERWIRAGKPDPRSVGKETWGKWAEEVSPGFSNWLKMVKKGPPVDRGKYKDMKFVWNKDVVGKLDSDRYIRWYDEELEWFMPDCSQSCVGSVRLGPNKYLVTKFTDATTYPEVGPAGSLPHGELLRPFSTDNKPLGEWVAEKNF